MDRNLIKRILCVLASMLFLTVKLADIPVMSAGAVYPDGHGRLVYENEDGYYYFANHYIVAANISGDVTIPSEIEGQPITEIIDYAFSKREGLTSVVIPEGGITVVARINATNYEATVTGSDIALGGTITFTKEGA